MKNFLIAVVFILCLSSIHAQDLILKTNGDTVLAKVLEVGTNAVSYKKFNYLDGPVFVENRADIRLIRFSNGDLQQFNEAEAVTHADSIKKMNSANNSSDKGTQQNEPQQTKNKIERKENKYFINNEPAHRKDVDRMLGSAKNPAIPLALKGAKVMKTAQTMVKITSYPTTIIGGAAFLVKGIDLWNDVQRGRATSRSYTNALWSMLTTISLPITNKILKKKSDKMYDKLIDMYNVTN